MGPGSLRNAVAMAGNGDSIDATHLTCSTITLTSGAIATAINQLEINGPGKELLAIDGNGQHRVFKHVPADPAVGNLRLSGMTVRNGRHSYEAGTAKGGCIYSSAFLVLGHIPVSGNLHTHSGVEVTGCTTASPTGGSSYGGGVYATGVDLWYSTVSGNRAEGTNGRGGGIFSRSSVNPRYSTLRDNYASYLAGGASSANGIASYSSTISVNRSGRFVGGLAVNGGSTSIVVNTTISGNSAVSAVGGIQFLTTGGLRIGNTTIAFNHIDTPDSGDDAGMFLRATALNLSGSIVWANKNGAGTENDVDGDSGATLTGHKNLIGSSSLGLPADSLIGFNPQLAPLARNGGPTSTHALGAGSPAINVGSNDINRSADQRGIGYPRIVGPQPDMGSFEFDPNRIFHDGFD